jgi:hypothetical protein
LYDYRYNKEEVNLDVLRDELEHALKKLHCTSNDVSDYSFDERISILESYLTEER